MNKIVKFKQWNCILHYANYQDGNRVAIELMNADPMEEDGYTIPPGYESIAMATVNIPHHFVPDNCVIIKDYSENEGMYEALLEAGIIGPVKFRVPSGYVICPVCELLVTKEMYEKLEATDH